MASGASRRAAISTASEVADIERGLNRPRLLHVTTSIVPVERCDIPGYECPITGHPGVRGLEEIADLSVLIRPSERTRLNRWTLDDAGRQQFDALVADAVDCKAYDPDAGAAMVHVPIVFACPPDHVDDLRNAATKVIYWSGGWRSGKTFRMDQWWLRQWVLRGGDGELFWLVGPDLGHAWNMATKIFHGRQATAPLAPVTGERDRWKHPVSWVTEDMPKSVYASNEFKFVDGAICQMHHAKGDGGNLEGESVQAIAIDEAVRIREVGPFNVCIGRVMQTRGQVGLASVPDGGEKAMWVYQNIVSRYEQEKTSPSKDEPLFLVRSVSSYNNPWLDPIEIDKYANAITDPTERKQKIDGQWTLGSMFAYADVWDEDKYTRDELSHEFGVWGLGPDITADVARRCLKVKRSTQYIIGADCNFDPQTRVIAKVFGNLDDWETWSTVFLHESSIIGDAEQAAVALRKLSKGRYKGSVVVIDGNAFYKGHRYGGRPSKTEDAFHYRKHGFWPVPAMRVVGDSGTGKVHYTCPGIEDSRTVVRNRMRAGRIFVNAGKCPQLLFAIQNAPNRKKRNSEKNTFTERAVYSFEDSMRYLIWRIYGRKVFGKQKKLDNELRGGHAA